MTVDQNSPLIDSILQQKLQLSWAVADLVSRELPSIAKNSLELEGGPQRTFRLKHGINDVVSSRVGFRTQSMEAFYVVLLLFLFYFKKRSPFTSIVLDLAATLLAPENLEVFCGLKHFPYPSIIIVVSR